MAGEHQSPMHPQWRRTLVSLQQAGIIASVREDECGLPWLYLESPDGEAYSPLGPTTSTKVGPAGSEYGVAGILPPGVAKVLVMSGCRQLIEAALGSGVWVALIPQLGCVGGTLFFDASGNILEYELHHQRPVPVKPPGWRSRLGVTLYGWVTRLRFVRMPRGEYTYGPGARRRD
ncbi:hypothetical protein NITHO_4380001 [Nitrolancea hollandica Lb]|uniref:Uncharacterized protein n=1 Tax=Nitrolancea hollandica Lb TaxID=1129897 RepID=I4EK27_9BACT|nr:hypothetical protein NITHO_4380001 [Nitrolancea hollandica Lb]